MGKLCPKGKAAAKRKFKVPDNKLKAPIPTSSPTPISTEIDIARKVVFTKTPQKVIYK